MRNRSGCGESAMRATLGTPRCLNSGGLLDTSQHVPTRAYPTQRRNQYRGPHYFDMDMNLFKNFKIAERFNLAIGAQAFNVFNHPNFILPNSDFFTGDPTFGTISSMQRRRPVRMATSWDLTRLRALCSLARRSCSSLTEYGLWMRGASSRGRPKVGLIFCQQFHLPAPRSGTLGIEQAADL